MQLRKDTLIRQKEIVAAARKLIVKHGSEHVTVRKMAEEIGVSEGAFYRHFKSKRDVLSFLVNDIEGTLIADIEQNYDSNINPVEVLERIATAHISAIEQKKGVAFQVIAEIISLGDKKLNQKIFEVINKYISRISSILNEGVSRGVIRPDINLETAAQMFFSMTQGIVTIWALSQYKLDLLSEYKSSWAIFRNSVVSANANSKLHISA